MAFKIYKSMPDGQWRKLTMHTGPIGWEPEFAFRERGGRPTGWLPYVPQFVDGVEVCRTLFDISVSLKGVLTGMGPRQIFNNADEAKAYVEATLALQGGDDETGS